MKYGIIYYILVSTPILQLLKNKSENQFSKSIFFFRIAFGRFPSDVSIRATASGRLADPAPNSFRNNR